MTRIVVSIRIQSFILLFILINTAGIASPPMRTINCSTIQQIVDAMANAQPGDDIVIAAGTYNATNKIVDAIGKFNYFTGGANGTSANPITLRGASSTNRPILKAADANKYGATIMSITGDYWIVKDIEFTLGQKGLILDGANHCKLINLSVHTISDEAVHIRSGSSNNLLQNCQVYNAGEVQPGFGEGIYVGSDQSQHTTYNPNCDNNIIENCKIGPNVRAEGIDIKEGTQFTIVRNCTFSGAGISGVNSADAFIDVKGGNTFIHNNTFNIDGSTIIASCMDFQQRTGVNSGFRIAMFNNTFNLGSNAANIPTARKKGGTPSQVHIWNNTRVPNPNDFPAGTLDFVTLSCPTWNILPCDGSTNQFPSVNISSPANNSNFTTGASITIQASASDSDGSVSKVEFFNAGTKLGEDTTSPYQFTIASAAAGNYSLTAKATDNIGASTTSSVVTVMVSSVATNNPPTVSITSPANNSNFTTGASITIQATAADSDGTVSKVEFFNGTTKLGEDIASPYQFIITSAAIGNYSFTAKATDNLTATKVSAAVAVSVTNASTGCAFGAPTTSSLPSFDRAEFKNIYVIGSGGPNISNIEKLSINWNLSQNSLTKFAVNTKNGSPSFYVDLRSSVTQNFSSTKPSVTITNSRVGLDGSYWVAKNNTDFVMVSKTSSYTVYFSNSATAPICSSARLAVNIAGGEELPIINEPRSVFEPTAFPNPTTGFAMIPVAASTTIKVINHTGAVVLQRESESTDEVALDLNDLPPGTYYIQTINKGITKSQRLILRK
jgi:endoglucanase